MKQKYPEFQRAETFIISKLEEELSPNLFYHNKAHTLDVLQTALEISKTESISAEEGKLLRIAVLFHDSGFLHVYNNHEEKGCEMARQYLPDFDFSPEQIELICEMIMATKVPQHPKTKLDQIIADADLDYLGREDVFIIAQKLFDELRIHNLLPDAKQWIPFQIDFLKEHRYFTDYSKKFRAPNKKLYLTALIAK